MSHYRKDTYSYDDNVKELYEDMRFDYGFVPFKRVDGKWYAGFGDGLREKQWERR
jgi:hypothetical protein